VYFGEEFHLEPTSEMLSNFTCSWKYTPLLRDYETEYTFLYLFLRNENLQDFCIDPQKYSSLKSMLKAQSKAALTAKVNLDSECFFDLLPEHQLNSWFSIRSTALTKLREQWARPTDYDILHKAHILTTEIGRQDLMFEGKKGRVQYNIFGSATGRLTTKKGSVPIMTLKKEARYKITPQNDAFVELDLNAAEVRTLMALSGREQPQEDIHAWVTKNVFNGEIDRSKAKVELFAWLYNPSSSESRFDEFFSRQIFRDFFDFETGILTTPFGRKLKVSERKAQNYLLQSTTSDIVIQNAYKIMKMLEGKKSKIAFTLHDSVVIDMDKEDSSMLRAIKEQFVQTPWGPFKGTCKIGKTFGNLKDLEV